MQRYKYYWCIYFNVTREFILTKQQRIKAFSELGAFLSLENEDLQAIISQAELRNPWFTQDNILRSVRALTTLLTRSNLEQWLAPYPFDQDIQKSIGLILAGNIPLVGFHDMLAVLISGFKVQAKLSSDDQVLYRFIINKLIKIEPEFESRIDITERLEQFDAIIATGSNNSSRYFEHYFGKYPHIIRKNRNGVAILDGKETKEDLHALGMDVFSYFGLGCRNVSKIFVPKGYDMGNFFRGIESYSDIIEHYKYNNNYDFNKSIYLINGDTHLDNGFLLVKPDLGLSSPLAVLFYEEYNTEEELSSRLNELEQDIQCIVGHTTQHTLGVHIQITPFGESQAPGLEDYADRVNTLDFLAKQYD